MNYIKKRQQEEQVLVTTFQFKKKLRKKHFLSNNFSVGMFLFDGQQPCQTVIMSLMQIK